MDLINIIKNKMCSLSVLCPLCAQTSFSSIDALRCSLIKAANGPLACPICHELFLGLDKLTIHLFSHTNIMNANGNSNSINNNINDDIKQIPKIMPTTTTTQQTVNNNNNNHIKANCNNEKGKTIEETLMPADQAVVQQQNHSEEANIENILNSHQQDIGIGDNFGALTPPQRATRKKTKLSKLNEQQPQVIDANETSAPVVSSPAQPSLTPLATCDICEFTFRNDELRDMHVRLVHQSLVYPNVGDAHTSAIQPNAQVVVQNMEPNFKCHLCSKIFKMKGSLRVHLKVVHLMGLPYVNNSPKLNICDRIRHKESKQLKILNTAAESTNQNLNTNNLNFNLQPISLIANMPNAIDSTENLSHMSVLNIAAPSTTEFIPNSLDPSKSLNSSVVFVLHSNNNNKNNNNNNSNNNNCINQSTTTNSATEKDISLPLTIHVNASAPTVSTATNLPNTDNAKIWECDVCSKAFTTKYFLKKHKRLHTGEMPYTCELCGRTFTFQQSYHKHLLYHSDEKPHVCSTCGRAFKELSTLHNHERIHSGEKPFNCDVCGKSFRQRVSFLVHSRIHTGVMPYKCESCQKSFRYKVSQRTHKCPSTAAAEETSLAPAQSLNQDLISENFFKVYMEKSTTQNAAPPLCSPASNEITAITDKIVTPSSTLESLSSTLNEQHAFLSKTIDDIVVESCNKLGIGNGSVVGFTPVEDERNEGSMSPSQKLQNMRLYSPQMVTPDMSGIEGDLTRFFLENSEGGQNIL